MGCRFPALVRRHRRDHPADPGHRATPHFHSVRPSRALRGHLRRPGRDPADDGDRLPRPLAHRAARQRACPADPSGAHQRRFAAWCAVARAGGRTARSDPGRGPARLPRTGGIHPRARPGRSVSHPEFPTWAGLAYYSALAPGIAAGQVSGRRRKLAIATAILAPAVIALRGARNVGERSTPGDRGGGGRRPGRPVSRTARCLPHRRRAKPHPPQRRARRAAPAVAIEARCSRHHGANARSRRRPRRLRPRRERGPHPERPAHRQRLAHRRPRGHSSGRIDRQP